MSRVLLFSMLPIVSISTLVMRSTLTSNTVFMAASNFTTSGGYGPNQVSALLGLGGLLGWLYLFIGRPSGTRFWLVVGLSALFILQAVLTLSRGGVANLVLAIPASAFFFLKGGKNAGRMVGLVLAITILFALAIPLLDAFTGGVMSVRYSDLDTTGRDKLV